MFCLCLIYAKIQSMSGKEQEDRLSKSLLETQRMKLEKVWSGFGGENGRRMNIQDVFNLVGRVLQLTWLERQSSEEERAVLDMMRINPLVEIEPAKINFSNPAVIAYAKEWLIGEKEILTLLSVCPDPTDENLAAIGRGEEIVDLESERRVRACSAGIKLLEGRISDKRG